MALDGKLEDTSYHSRRFPIDQPVVFVIEVFLVTIDGAVGGGLPDSLDSDGGALLAAQIPQIPFCS